VRPARAAGAAAVDLAARTAAETHVVERPLPETAHPVHVAGERLLELLGANARRPERVRDRVLAEVGEVPVAALELGHADADHAHFSLGHGTCSSSRWRRVPYGRLRISARAAAPPGLPRGPARCSRPRPCRSARS